MKKSRTAFLAFIALSFAAVFFSCKASLDVLCPPPANLHGGKTGSGTIILSWDAVDGASYYNIYRETGKSKLTFINTAGASCLVKFTSQNSDESYVVSSVSGSKEGLAASVTKKAASLWYGSLWYNSTTERLEWTSCPSSSTVRYFVYETSSTEEKISASFSAWDSVCTTTSCYLPVSSLSEGRIDSEKFYGVLVLDPDEQSQDYYYQFSSYVSGFSLLSNPKQTSSGSGSPSAETDSALPGVTDLGFAEYVTGVDPEFTLCWSETSGAEWYSVYAFLSESADETEDSLLEKWVLAGNTEVDEYYIPFASFHGIFSGWTGENDMTAYFKVVSMANGDLQPGNSNIVRFTLPMESFSYPCAYTVSEAVDYGVTLYVVRTGEYDYKFIWNDISSYCPSALYGSSFSNLSFQGNASSPATISMNQMGMSDYKFFLIDSPFMDDADVLSARVSNYVTCTPRSDTYYFIAYNLNGGENNALNPKYYSSSDDMIFLEEPTREYYEFCGWYEEEDFSGSEVMGIDTTEERNITLYAKWSLSSSVKPSITSYTTGTEPTVTFSLPASISEQELYIWENSAWVKVGTLSSTLTLPLADYFTWNGSAAISTKFAFSETSSYVPFEMPAASYGYASLCTVSEEMDNHLFVFRKGSDTFDAVWTDGNSYYLSAYKNGSSSILTWVNTGGLKSSPYGIRIRDTTGTEKLKFFLHTEKDYSGRASNYVEVTLQ